MYMNKQKNIASGIALGILLIAASFYGGMVYGKKGAGNSSQVRQQAAQGQGGNQNGQVGQRGAGRGMMQGGGNGNGGEFTSGQIISKDDTSITVKTRDGGSKIIFFSGSTAIDKSVFGSASDLSVDQQVTASGKSNPDGSVTAQTIQIRPAQANEIK
jgi:hypothetical protein